MLRVKVGNTIADEPVCEIFDVFVATELSEISVDVQQSLDVSTATDERGKCLEALIRP